MLDDIRRQHELKTGILEGQRTDVTTANRAEPLGLAVAYRLVAEFETDGTAIAAIAQHAQVGPGAGADIEDAGRGVEPKCSNLAGKQPPAADKPPVTLL